MGTCFSKKAAKKQQEPQEEEKPSPPKSSPAFTPNPTTTSAPALVAEASVKEKPQPEEESVKEILTETNGKRDCHDEITDKPSTEPPPAFASAVKKNPSFKKKGSFKRDQAEKPMEEVTPLARTSSAREDVDAILIQCGRLSRSSSGRMAASGDANGGRQYSGSKRHAADEEADGKENGISRPSHRRSSSRDLTVTEGGNGGGSRSASRDRGGSDGKRVTGRRISPSPGRRAEPSPGRRVENQSRVGHPARGAAKRIPSVKRGANSGELVNTRSAAPLTASRSRSPAPRQDSGAGVPQSLSRSSSRKAEQSPFRRPPGEENPAPAAGEYRGNENKMVSNSTAQILDENCDAVKKEKRVALKEINGGSGNIREQLLSCRAPAVKEKESSRKPLAANGVEVDGEVKDDGDRKVLAQISRSRSSRRSRDQFVLEIDEVEMKGFSLPASVSKAQSILEAVADLNSSVNSNSSLRSSAESQGKSENSEVLKEFQRNVSRRNSNVDWTEESAGSSRLSAARPHRQVSSEEEETMSFESSRNVSSKNEIKQGSARYFNISPEDVILNPYLGIKGGESSNRSNLMPVITLGKKDFQHGKRATNLQPGRAALEQSKENANPRATNSRAASDPGVV